MKHPEVAAFMKRVMEITGAKNPTVLSNQLGGTWTTRDQQRKLYKWHAGDTAPNFYGTVTLLRLSGLMVDEPATARHEPASIDEATLAALDRLADLRDQQDAVIDELLGRVAERRRPQRVRRRRAG